MKSIVEARRFTEIAADFLRSVGAVKGTQEHFPLQIETIVGTLVLNTEASSFNGRFLDVKRARPLIKPKNYAWDGRWGHDYYESPMSADQVVEDFQKELLPLLLQGGPVSAKDNGE